MFQDWSQFNKYYADECTTNPLSEQYLRKYSAIRLIGEDEENSASKQENGAPNECSLLVSPKQLFYIERAFENRNFSVVEEVN